MRINKIYFGLLLGCGFALCAAASALAAVARKPPPNLSFAYACHGVIEPEGLSTFGLSKDAVTAERPNEAHIPLKANGIITINKISLNLKTGNVEATGPASEFTNIAGHSTHNLFKAKFVIDEPADQGFKLILKTPLGLKLKSRGYFNDDAATFHDVTTDPDLVVVCVGSLSSGDISTLKDQMSSLFPQ
jgi:hypothetical protein